MRESKRSIHLPAARTGLAVITVALLITSACGGEASDVTANPGAVNGPKETMDAVLTEKAPPSPTPVDESAVRDWLNQQAQPILSYDFDAPNDDLSFLDDFVAGKRIMLLGDATYGTHEFLATRARIVRYMVEELGYRTIIVEDSYGQMQLVDQALQSGNADLHEVLANYSAFWLANQEFLDLAQWLRSYNRSHPRDKVHLQGFKVNVADHMINNVLEFVAHYMDDRFDEYEQRLQCARYNNLGIQEIDSLENCLSGIQAISEDFHAGIDGLTLDTSRRQAQTLEQELEWVADNVESYLVNASGSEDRGDYLYRKDLEIAKWLLEQVDEGKTIILAHNSQVAHEEYGIGAGLYRDYGAENMTSIGLAFSEGSFLAMDANGNQEGLSEYQKNGSLDSYYEHYLALADAPAYFLDLGQAKAGEPGGAWLLDKRNMQFAVWYANRETNDRSNVSVFITEDFDGLIYIENTTPAQEFSEWFAGPNVRVPNTSILADLLDG